MIFVTVGEQLPFDRLIRAMDQWVASSGIEVFAQIGLSKWKPSHMPYKEFLDPHEYKECFQKASLIVAHAGMGTIISALEMGKPILVMPRQKALGEHRNDHQSATAQRFQALNYISVAMDEIELAGKLNTWKEGGINQEKKENNGPAQSLIKTIRQFVEKE